MRVILIYTSTTFSYKYVDSSRL